MGDVPYDKMLDYWLRMASGAFALVGMLFAVCALWPHRFGTIIPWLAVLMIIEGCILMGHGMRLGLAGFPFYGDITACVVTGIGILWCARRTGYSGPNQNIANPGPSRHSARKITMTGLVVVLWIAMVLVWRNRPQPEGEGPPATRTLTGTFKWNGAQDRQHRVTVVLTPAGGSNWIAHYTAYWDRSTISYQGILTGDLENGEVTGTAASVDGKRTWQLTGKAVSGVIEAQHWEITSGTPQLTGTLTLKR
jgi:hypothetical protein